MKEYRDILYSTSDNPQQQLNIYMPEQDCLATLVYFHGGGFQFGCKEDADPIAKYLTSKGIAMVSANYRLSNEAKWPDYIHDAAAAVAWTVEHIGEYGGSGRIFAGGSSAGGYLSMMLCFDKRYLAPFGIRPTDIAGYVHDSGQPTAHYSVLESKGIDPRRIVVDESAPLFFVGTDEKYSPMLILVADNDMGNRQDQTVLLVSTLKQFNMPEKDITFKVLHGEHCEHCFAVDENGDSVLAKIIEPFIMQHLS